LLPQHDRSCAGRLDNFAPFEKKSAMSDRVSRVFRALLLNAITFGALIASDAEASADLQALTDNRVMTDWLILAGVIVVAAAVYFFERG
jgi:hypothetical protein